MSSVGAFATAALAAASALAAPPAPSEGLAPNRDQHVQTTFESVDATIAAQWDFPAGTPAPLVVLIPSQGRLDRDGRLPGTGNEGGMYSELADALVRAGFAVFRFDKPGAGRSAPGHFATERSNAIEAYTRAIDHARVDRDNVFLVAHAMGSDAVAGIYPRYQAVVPPRGVVFLDNAVGERLCLEVKAPLLIVNPNKDPDDRYTYGEFVVESRSVAEGGKLATDLVLVDDAEHGLLAPGVTGSERLALHPRAVSAMVDWLQKKRTGLPSSARNKTAHSPDAPRAAACPPGGPGRRPVRFLANPLLASVGSDSVN